MSNNFILAQLNFKVGALEENFQKISDTYLANQAEHDFIAYPELAVCGYPPEDLLFNQNFLNKIIKLQDSLIKLTKDSECALIFGGIEQQASELYNCIFVAQSGAVKAIARKNNLPNYGVFDEKRYFAKGLDFTICDIAGCNYLLLNCEDFWSDNLRNKTEHLDYEKVLVLNSSPFALKKYKKRRELSKVFDCPVLYLNMLGGQDNLVFDGGSFIKDEQGTFLQAPFFIEKLLSKDDFIANFEIDEIGLIYEVLLLAIRDYLSKNQQNSVILGLSGGIDSALIAVLAADSLGSKKVNLVTMPSRYTSEESVRDAAELINNLGCKNIFNLNIEDPFQAFTNNLQDAFKDHAVDLTEENLQSRIRGVYLMALSNKLGHLVLATSNKSEAAVGYSTLYGDMCGAFSPLKDVYKTTVYQLAKWRNEHIPATSLCQSAAPLPENIITKAPTAELRPEQKDSDSLPEYEQLDQILYHLIECYQSVAQVIKLGFKEEEVLLANKLLKNSEYKRYQAALGPKISALCFDKERRYPLSNAYENLD